MSNFQLKEKIMANEKKSTLLIDKILEASKEERIKETFSNLKTGNDVHLALPLLVRLLNTSKDLGLRFLADPFKFFEDMDVTLSPEVKKHLLNVMGVAKNGDSQAYEEIKKGKTKTGYIDSFSFSLPDEIIQKLPKKYDPNKILEKGVGSVNYTDMINFAIPPGGLLPVLGASSPAKTPKSVNIGGWDIAVEIHESFIRDVMEKYFTYQFAGAILKKLFEGVSESELVEPWHDAYGWFLVFFHVHFTFDNNARPEFSLDTGSSDLVKIILKIKGELRMRSSQSDNWSDATAFTATVEKSA